MEELDAIAQVMALKAQFNLGRECYDAMMTIFGRFLPKGHVLQHFVEGLCRFLHLIVQIPSIIKVLRHVFDPGTMLVGATTNHLSSGTLVTLTMKSPDRIIRRKTPLM